MPLILTTRNQLSPRYKNKIQLPELAEQAEAFYTRTLSRSRKREPLTLPLVVSPRYGLLEARKTITSFLEDHERTVFLILEERHPILNVKLKKQIISFLEPNQMSVSEIMSDYHYNGDMRFSIREDLDSKQQRALSEAVKRREESFSEMLFRLIREKHLEPVKVYKKANIDRKLFSKIKNRSSYQPSRQTAIALGIALKLNYDQMLDLLGKAGFTLSHSSTFDLIIEFFITRENWDIFEINEALFTFDQQLLGI